MEKEFVIPEKLPLLLTPHAYIRVGNPERKENYVIPGMTRYPVKKSALPAVYLQLDSRIRGNDMVCTGLT